MKIENEYMAPHSCPPIPGELHSFVDRHFDDLRRVVIDRKKGRKIIKINAIHITKNDNLLGILEAIWNIACSDLEIHSERNFRIFAYKDNDGDTESANFDFSVVDETENDDDDDARSKTSWIDVLQTQLKVQQNLMERLITKLITLSTSTVDAQSKTIEHLAGKYLEGLAAVEHTLELKFDAAKEERREQARAETTSHIAEIVKGVMPVLKHQIQSSIDNANEKTDMWALEKWREIRKTISNGTLSKIESQLPKQCASSLATLMGSMDRTEIREAVQAFVKCGGEVSVLEDALSQEQGDALAALVKDVFLA
jgi:hypothetical protein